MSSKKSLDIKCNNDIWDHYIDGQGKLLCYKKLEKKNKKD